MSFPVAGRGAIFLGLVALVACTALGNDRDAVKTTRAASPSSSTLPTRVSPPFDVASVRARYAAAFHADGDGFAASHVSHGVRASASGIDFAPKGSSALHLGAPAVTRGGASVAGTGGGSARLDADGSVVVDRGPLRERLTSGEGFAEHSFSFDRAPPGAGDLVLRLAASGERLRATTATGLHFVDPKTGSGVAYGVGTWVDARGSATPVLASFEGGLEGGSIVLRVPEATLARSAYPATLDPNVSPERGVDQPIFGTPTAGGLNASPAIDFDGTNYFVVWTDDRIDLGGIFGAHVRSDGSVVESAPIVVSPGYPGSPPTSPPVYTATSQVAVAFDGTNHLVAYVDQRDGHAAISAKRVSASGVVLDAAPLAVSPPIGADASGPSVAYDGGEYFVVWSDARNAPASAWDVFGTRVTVGGSVLNASSVKLSGASGSNLDPKVVYGGATSGDDYVVWSHDDGTFTSVHGALLTTGGGIISTDISLAAGNAAHYNFHPSVASSGSGYLVAYLDTCLTCDAPGTPGSVAVLPVGANGQPTAGSPVELTPLENPGTQGTTRMYSTPSVAFNGTSFIVAWSSPTTMTAEEITLAGATTSTVYSVPINDDEEVAPGNAVIAATSVGAMVAAHTSANPPELVAPHQPNGGNIGPFEEIVSMPVDFAHPHAVIDVVSAAANEEDTPALGFDGEHYLVVWADDREAGSGSQVFGILVDENGIEVPDAGEVPVAGGGIDAGYPLGGAFPIMESPPATNLRVAFDGTDYLVAFAGGEPGMPLLYGKRVSTSGQIVGDTADSPGTILVSPSASNAGPFDLAFDGKSFVLAYWDQPGSYGVVDAVHINVGPSAIALTGTTATLLGSAAAPIAGPATPALATNGATVLVAAPAVASGAAEIAYVEVPDPFPGAPPPATTIPLGSTSVGGVAAEYDSVAAAYRLAWTDDLGSAGDPHVFFQTAGSGSPTRVTDSHAAPGLRPVFAFDGKDGLLVWSDQRGGTLSLDLYGARVDNGGALLDTTSFPISVNAGTPSFAPAALGDKSSSTLVVYSRFIPSMGEARIAARVVAEVTSESLGVGCTSGSDCASGFCVDGVCCNSACGAANPTRCSVCAAAAGASADGQCTVLSQGFVCRAPTGACDLAGLCDGTDDTCPTDTPAPNGTLCASGVCVSGACVAASDAAAPDAGADAETADAAADAGQRADAGADAAADASAESGSDAGLDAAEDSGEGAQADAASAGDAGGAADAADAGDAAEDAGPTIVVLDAAPPPAGDASFAPFPAASGGCSCRVSGDGAGGSAASWLAAPLLALALAARRRRAIVPPTRDRSSSTAARDPATPRAGDRTPAAGRRTRGSGRRTGSTRRPTRSANRGTARPGRRSRRTGRRTARPGRRSRRTDRRTARPGRRSRPAVRRTARAVRRSGGLPIGDQDAPFADRQTEIGDRHAPFAHRQPPFGDRHAPFAHRQPPFGDRHAPFAHRQPPFGDRHAPFAHRQPPFDD